MDETFEWVKYNACVNSDSYDSNGNEMKIKRYFERISPIMASIKSPPNDSNSQLNSSSDNEEQNIW